MTDIRTKSVLWPVPFPGWKHNARCDYAAIVGDRVFGRGSHRRLIKEGGIQALKRQINEDHIHANRTDQETAEAIIELSLNYPHLGQVQVSNHLKQSSHIDISASGVRQVWLRANMQTIALRMQKRSQMPNLV